MRRGLFVTDFTFRAAHDGTVVLFERYFKHNNIHIQGLINAFLLKMDKF